MPVLLWPFAVGNLILAAVEVDGVPAAPVIYALCFTERVNRDHYLVPFQPDSKVSYEGFS